MSDSNNAPIDASEMARVFHETYEGLAPIYGYKTRDASAVPWVDVPEKNKQLMIATCQAVIGHFYIAEGMVECDEHEWYFYQTEDNRQWGQRCRKCHKWQDEWVHADSAAPSPNMRLPWEIVAIHTDRGTIIEVLDNEGRSILPPSDDYRFVGPMVEAVNAYWKTECVIERQKFNQAMKDDKSLRQRVAELEAECERTRKHWHDQLKACTLERVVSEERFAEIARLREALKTVRGKVEHPRVYADVIDIIDQALTGAEDGRDMAEQCDTSVEVPDEATGQNSSAMHEESNSPTPRPIGTPQEGLKPLKLRHADEMKSLRELIDWNTNRLLDRDAEIVAAIAELDWHLRHKGDLMNNLNDKIGRYKRDAAAQISAQADKQDEMQVAIDQIRSVQDAAS